MPAVVGLGHANQPDLVAALFFASPCSSLRVLPLQTFSVSTSTMLRSRPLAARDDGPAKSSFEIEAEALRKQASALSSGAKDVLGRMASGDAGRDAADAARDFASKARSGSLASDAMEAIERAAQEAAGQSEAEVAAAKGLVAPGVASALPDSFEDAVSTAVSTAAAALADGSPQLIIEFDTAAGHTSLLL